MSKVKKSICTKERSCFDDRNTQTKECSTSTEDCMCIKWVELDDSFKTDTRNKKMNFSEYQTESRKTAIYLNGIKKEFPDLPKQIYKLLAISYVGNGMGEVGEVQGKIKKIIRDSKGIITDEHKKEIGKELGDVLWYIANMCTELDINMNEIAIENIQKLNNRKERGVIKGSGDNR